MARVLSGIQPTGDIHLGNYLGAIRRWVDDQHAFDAFYCVVDLHAVTVPHDPAALRAKTRQTAQVLLAAGLDPDVCTLFVQSHLHEHSELAWLLNCVATVGELRRMVQFKEKSGGQDSVSVGLFDYPVLQAADILLYQAERVPVGEDQRQHLELTRNLAVRFNQRYGPAFTVPEAAIAPVGAKIQDLQNPSAKMSKSADSPQGTLLVLDPPDVVRRKVRRAVTDPGTDVRYDPVNKPGVSNLLSILAVVTGRTAEQVAERYHQYGSLKADTADALVEYLRPLQERFEELSTDPTGTDAVLEKGADKAGTVAAETLRRAQDAMGLLPRG